MIKLKKNLPFFEEKYRVKTLGKKVDLVPKNALKPRICKHILEEVKYI